MPHDYLTWAAGAAGGVLIGVSKTGMPGLGVLAVVLLALLLPQPTMAVGVTLLLLICGDWTAVLIYRRQAAWPHLWRMFPWAAAGVVFGWAVLLRMSYLPPQEAKVMLSRLVGLIILALISVHAWQRYRASQAERAGRKPESEPTSHGLAYVVTMGLLAGFTTMVANAAGPVMILYLLALRLPKEVFVGTAAWFFLIVNLFKVPFSVHAGMIDAQVVTFAAQWAGFVVLGAIAGRFLLARIRQEFFENLALALSVLAAVKLLCSGMQPR